MDVPGTALNLLTYLIIPGAQPGDWGCHGQSQKFFFFFLILYVKVLFGTLLVTLLKQFCL